MMRRSMRWMVCAALVASLGLVACSSSDDDDNDDNGGVPVASVNVDGVYTGTRSNTNGAANVTFNFSQNGAVLGGSYTDSSIGNGVISGSVDGDNIEFTTVMTQGGLVVDWFGETAGDGATISGTWTVTVGGSAEGTWSAAR